MMYKFIKKEITKREFLKILGISSTSLFASGLLADELQAKSDGLDNAAIKEAAQTTIYHTSTRGRKSCRACRNHAVNRMYRSREAADQNRAHPGCNCRIVEEQISWQNYVKAFWPDSPGGEIVYDRRWGWPPPTPPEFEFE